MIACDPDVFVRRLVRDGSPQAAPAKTSLGGLISGPPSFVRRKVMAELVLALVHSHSFAKVKIASLASALLSTMALPCKQAADFATAAFQYGNGGAEFPEPMILVAGRCANARLPYPCGRKGAKIDGLALRRPGADRSMGSSGQNRGPAQGPQGVQP